MAISFPASHHQHHRQGFSEPVQPTGSLIAQPRTLPMPGLSARRRGRTTGMWITAATRHKAIDGVGEELNAVASQNLDFAPARRLVRSAFLNVQQHLDHFLFKVLALLMHRQWGSSDLWSLSIIIVFFEGIAKRIAAAGYGVYAMDYPGFGLSQGLHGYIHSFDEMVDHVIEQYALIRATKQVRGLPHFLLGQSMGGAVALKVHLKQPNEWDGVVLVAPMCKIAEDVTPPGPILKALTLMSYVLPEAKLFPQKDLAELAFRDPTKRKLANFNVIAYSDQMRLRTAIELIKATHDIESQLEKVSSPLLILHGAADKVTDPNVSKFLYDKACSKDKSLKLYEDSYHSILEGEPDDRISSVIDDVISWLDSHSSLE